MVVTEEPYQGEDAIELVEVDYEPLPAVVDLADAPRPTRRCCSRRPGTNIAANFGDPRRSTSTCSTAARSSSRQTIINQRVAPAPMETRAGRGRLGRGRPADRLDPEPGRAGHRGSAGRAARHRAEPGPGDHPRRRRRVRREVRRRPRARGGGLGGPAARPPGAVDRDPVREPDRDDARPGAAADRHDRRQPGRHRAGLPAGDRAGLPAPTRGSARSCRR